MQVLQCSDFDALFEERPNPPRGSMRCSHRRDARYIVANCGATDRFLVVERLASERGVDNEVDLAGFHQVHDIRAPFVDLEYPFGLDASSLHSRARSPS